MPSPVPDAPRRNAPSEPGFRVCGSLPDRELACSLAESSSGPTPRIRSIPETLPSWIVIAALAVAAISLLLSLLAIVRRRRSRRRPGQVPTAVDASTFDELDALSRRVAALEGVAPLAVQRVGVVRFNPFPDTGGNQSFVVALLDARGDGVVLSSLHSRGGTRVYLKQVASGTAETALSVEELEAIRRARGNQ